MLSSLAIHNCLCHPATEQSDCIKLWNQLCPPSWDKKAQTYSEDSSGYKYCSMRAHQDHNDEECIAESIRKVGFPIATGRSSHYTRYSRISKSLRRLKCLRLPVKLAETHRRCSQLKPLRLVPDNRLLSHVESGTSQTLTSYLSASPTITERVSNNLPDKNRRKRLEDKIASLDSKIRGKGSGSG